MENQNIIINVQSCASSTHITQMPWIGLKNLSKNNAHAPRSIVQCTVFKHFSPTSVFDPMFLNSLFFF